VVASSGSLPHAAASRQSAGDGSLARCVCSVYPGGPADHYLERRAHSLWPAYHGCDFLPSSYALSITDTVAGAVLGHYSSLYHQLHSGAAQRHALGNHVYLQPIHSDHGNCALEFGGHARSIADAEEVARP